MLKCTNMNNEYKSNYIRTKMVKISEKQVLISRLKGSLQEDDITLPVNCNGFGRIRHFRICEYRDWMCNPLPNLPAAKALNIEPEPVLKTQVFQIAGCNWDCWYCFVDDDLKKCDPLRSKWFTTDELIDLLLKEKEVPKVIDLSGGQPDLVPEWIFWMMKSLEEHEMGEKIYLWSDDNLSTFFYWKYLTHEQRKYMSNYKNYGKVCCFKGYDKKSFKFNTLANEKQFDMQFEVFSNLLSENLDLYAYVTFTAPKNSDYKRSMAKFIDNLQNIHDKLPLRTVPLKIVDYIPTSHRLTKTHKEALSFQHILLGTWMQELHERYTAKELETPICDISLF